MTSLTPHSNAPPRQWLTIDIWLPLRYLINHIEIHNAQFAHLLARSIPCCCPFERDIHLLGHPFHIPPLCKLNPLYDEVVALRFRALSYLADHNQDITRYICD